MFSLAKSKEGEDRELFKVRSEPKPAFYSSWGAEGIGGDLSARPDDRPGSRGGDCRYSTIRGRRGGRMCGATLASRAC